MRKLFLLLGCLFIFTGCVKSNVPPKLSGEELASQLAAETAALVYNDDGDIKVYCTATFIGADTLLSAAHCGSAIVRKLNGDEDDDEVKMPKDFQLSFVVQSEMSSPGAQPSKTHLATVVYHNVEQDLMILKVVPDSTLPYHPYAAIATKLPAVGSRLAFMGHPDRVVWSYRSGVVSG